MPDGPCQTASREKHFKIITSCVCHYVQMIVIFKPGNLQRNPVGPSACCRAARAGVGEQYMSPPQQLEISRNIETTLSPSLSLPHVFPDITNTNSEYHALDSQASADCQAANVLRLLTFVSLTSWQLLSVIVDYAVIGEKTSISTCRWLFASYGADDVQSTRVTGLIGNACRGREKACADDCRAWHRSGSRYCTGNVSPRGNLRKNKSTSAAGHAIYYPYIHILLSLQKGPLASPTLSNLRYYFQPWLRWDNVSTIFYLGSYDSKLILSIVRHLCCCAATASTSRRNPDLSFLQIHLQGWGWTDPTVA
ncbi:uncharacterized protein K489DRAFT_91551 [Dissoconium aciculare CBS 342.82]|uniref:Uncharacterized protein n=1 Tax=Dissoconium aciculare CBS 342.82 TaxID=1314786 RepID=A0A6J3LRW6_9PEZI|nr:uncharacterized protein K489DRAFT_91551 [Dissoconium aciculare CBS 342.82]KAF1818566.1 hypothetical protein K489DRAFT_91551 [Dissoconium aciculare CBS 342.82]